MVVAAEAVACNLCGADGGTVLAERDRYGLETRIVQCECGLRYINPRMSAEQYDEFYRSGYRPLLERYMGRDYPLAEVEHDQWKYAADLSSRVARWMPEGARYLDVGGSTGIVGRLFRERFGGTVTVIDPAAQELARARGCRQICARAEDVTVFPPSDVALVCRAVDHLLDPKGVLTRLRSAARWLVVDAMDVDGWPEQARYKVDHPYAFTATTLKRMVETAGWRIVAGWKRRGNQYVGLLCSSEES